MGYFPKPRTKLGYLVVVEVAIGIWQAQADGKME